jgi:hypothetical protein
VNDYFDSEKMRVGCVDHEGPDHMFMAPACSKYNGGPGSDFDKNTLFDYTWGGASRKCFMGEQLIETGLNYLRDWIKVYDGKRKYFTWRTCLMHNIYGETSHDMDNALETFLIDSFGKDGSKQPNTIIRIYADHGDHQTYFK